MLELEVGKRYIGSDELSYRITDVQDNVRDEQGQLVEVFEGISTTGIKSLFSVTGKLLKRNRDLGKVSYFANELTLLEEDNEIIAFRGNKATYSLDSTKREDITYTLDIGLATIADIADDIITFAKDHSFEVGDLLWKQVNGNVTYSCLNARVAEVISTTQVKVSSIVEVAQGDILYATKTPRENKIIILDKVVRWGVQPDNLAIILDNDTIFVKSENKYNECVKYLFSFKGSCK